jgi:hypothetical protein
MSLLTRQQVADLLGQCPKTIIKMINFDGLPMSKVGVKWMGEKNDIIRWIRTRYPNQYKDAINRLGENATTTRTRGQLNMEAYGIVENKEGKKRIVEGREYVLFTRNDTEDEIFLGTYHRGTCSFEQTIKEPAI